MKRDFTSFPAGCYQGNSLTPINIRIGPTGSTNSNCSLVLGVCLPVRNPVVVRENNLGWYRVALFKEDMSCFPIFDTQRLDEGLAG